MKNANTKSRASSVSKLRARLLTSWAAVSVLSASLLFMVLLTGCPQTGGGSNHKNSTIFKTDGNGKITGYKCAKEALPANLVIPAKIGDEVITGIGKEAFYDCDGLTSISFPESLTYIQGRAFQYCKGLASITLPQNLKSIDYCAFWGCEGLTSINIPSKVTSIGAGILGGCINLTTLTVADDNETYKSENNVVYTKDMKTLISAAASLSSVTIPAGVISIEKSGFRGCKN